MTYVVQRKRCFVDSRADQSINPKFVNVVHHLVFDPREDEINNAASGGRVEEGISIEDVEIIHPALLKRGSEELLLWLDDTLVHPEDLGEPVEVAKGRARFQVVWL